MSRTSRPCSHTHVQTDRSGRCGVRDDLQELVDDVSRLLAAPATLEDADFTLLAFCAHDDAPPGAMDAVRTRSILTRGSPAETRRWFEEFGIASAEAPLRTPADPAAGILTRLVIPVRHARPHPRLPVAARRRADRPRRHRPIRRWPRRSSSPPRPGGCSPTAAAADDLGRPLAAALTGARRRPRPGGPRPRRAPSADPPLVLVALAPGPDGPARQLAAARRRARWPRCSTTAGRPPSSCPCPARRPPPGGRARRRVAGRACRRAAPPGCPRCAGASTSWPSSGTRPAPRRGWPPRPPLLPRRPLGGAGRLAAGRRAGRPRPRRPPAAGRPRARRDRRGVPRLRRQRLARRRGAAASTGRRCTTGSPGSRRSPASTSPTARRGCCCTPRSRPPACARVRLGDRWARHGDAVTRRPAPAAHRTAAEHEDVEARST